MRVYIDANVLVSFIGTDGWTQRVYEILATEPRQLVVSDFCLLEVASVLSRLVRTNSVSRDFASSALFDLDAWIDTATVRAEISPDDVAAATAFVRELRYNVRGPDALHLACAYRNGDAIWSFDFGLRDVAGALGLETVPALI